MKIKISVGEGTPKNDPQIIQSGLHATGFTLTKDDKKFVYTKVQTFSNLGLINSNRKAKSEQLSYKMLTRGTSRYEYPVFSPNGKELAFTEQGQLYKMLSDGSEMQQMTFLDSDCIDPQWSPDGREIAFISNGKVWKISSDGGIPSQIQNTQASIDLSWAPGENILYLFQGNRNYKILNPKTTKERSLVQNDSVGWMFEAQYSPDGKNVVINWNRVTSTKPFLGHSKLYIISLEDSLQSILQSLDDPNILLPIGWSSDSKWVYANRYDNPEIVERLLVSTGKKESFVTLPFESVKHLNISPDGTQIICTVLEVLSDVWVLENFDPGIR
jgi:Tol biopolymer transport system component